MKARQPFRLKELQSFRSKTGAVPAIRVDTFTKGEGHQLAGVDSANVARGGAVSPRRLTGVVTNLERQQ